MTTDTPIEGPAESARLSPIEIVLAALWLALPAAQYAGSYARTRATVAREVPGSGIERLDLTPWYILLLGLTLMHATIKKMAKRSAAVAAVGGKRW